MYRRVSHQPPTQQDKGQAGEQRRRKPDHSRDDEGVQKPGDLAQGFDHPELIRFDRQTIDDEVVVHGQLDTEEYAHRKDSDRQQGEIPIPLANTLYDPSHATMFNQWPYAGKLRLITSINRNRGQRPQSSYHATV